MLRGSAASLVHGGGEPCMTINFDRRSSRLNRPRPPSSPPEQATQEFSPSRGGSTTLYESCGEPINCEFVSMICLYCV